MPKLDPEMLLIAFIAVTAAAVLLQTILLLAIYLTVRGAMRKISRQVNELRASVLPIIDLTREVVERVAPRIEDAVEDLAGIAESLRTQTAEVQATVGELLERVRQQTARVDIMLSNLLNSADRVGDFFVNTVGNGVRQFNAVQSTARAIMDALRRPAK